MEGYNELEVSLLINASAMGCDGRDPFVEACNDDEDDDIWFHQGYAEELRVGEIEAVG